MIQRKSLLGIALFFVSLVSSWSLQALSQPAVFEFALPEKEGTISLGIYDSLGNLIRTLACNASIDAFEKGENGLIASWDGTTNSGGPAAPGNYEVKGVVIGKMELEGMGFHFNDWVTSNEGPFPIRILAIAQSFQGTPLILWERLDHRMELACFGNSEQLLWTQELPPHKPISELSLSPICLAPISLCASSEGLLALLNSPSLWQQYGITRYRLLLPNAAQSMAPGRGKTFWILSLPQKQPGFLGQFDWQGTFLRRIALASRWTQGQVAASPHAADVLLLLSDGAGASEFHNYHFSPAAALPSTRCEDVWHRSLTPCQDFGLTQGKLVPKISDIKEIGGESSVKIALIPDSLNPSPQSLSIQGKILESTAWITTAEGLPLFPVGALPFLQRVVVSLSQEKNTLHIFCGNGAVVAEFRVKNITDMSCLYAGWISWQRP